MNRFFKTVLLTGLFAGTMDLIYAYITSFIKSGKLSGKMLHFIAAGGLGKETAMNGGNEVAFLGLFFHYFIAFSFTLFFFWIFPKLKFLSFNKYLVGMLYAVFVNLVMGQIILKLTPLHGWTFNLEDAILDWYPFGVVFGIPIVYNTYKYYGVPAEKLVR